MNKNFVLIFIPIIFISCAKYIFSADDAFSYNKNWVIVVPDKSPNPAYQDISRIDLTQEEYLMLKKILKRSYKVDKMIYVDSITGDSDGYSIVNSDLQVSINIESTVCFEYNSRFYFNEELVYFIRGLIFSELLIQGELSILSQKSEIESK